MPVFPITYAKEQAPQQSGSVRANLDTDTGAGAVAGAVAHFGNTLGNVGMEIAGRIEAAQDALDLPVLKRKHDEIINTGYQEASLIADEGKAQERWNKAKADAAQVSSDRPRVNIVLREHINSVAPVWDKNYAIHRLAIKKKNTIDRALGDSEAAIARGDPLGAATPLQQILPFAPEMQAQIEQMTKEIPFAAGRATVIKLAETDPAAAEIERAKLVPVTPQQVQENAALKAHNETMTRRIAAQKQDDADRVAATWTNKVVQARNLGPKEKGAVYDTARVEMGKLAEAGMMSAESLRAFNNYVDASEAQKLQRATAAAKVGFVQRLGTIPPAELEKWVAQNPDAFGEDLPDYLEKAKALVAKDVVDEAKNAAATAGSIYGAEAHEQANVVERILNENKTKPMDKATMANRANELTVGAINVRNAKPKPRNDLLDTLTLITLRENQAKHRTRYEIAKASYDPIRMANDAKRIPDPFNREKTISKKELGSIMQTSYDDDISYTKAIKQHYTAMTKDNPVDVKTEDDAIVLPEGTVYRTPDGRMFTR